MVGPDQVTEVGSDSTAGFDQACSGLDLTLFANKVGHAVISIHLLAVCLAIARVVAKSDGHSQLRVELDTSTRELLQLELGFFPTNRLLILSLLHEIILFSHFRV